jgi:hypothetical protein
LIFLLDMWGLEASTKKRGLVSYVFVHLAMAASFSRRLNGEDVSLLVLFYLRLGEGYNQKGER